MYFWGHSTTEEPWRQKLGRLLSLSVRWEQCICLRIWSYVLVGKRTAVWGVVFHFHPLINFLSSSSDTSPQISGQIHTIIWQKWAENEIQTSFFCDISNLSNYAFFFLTYSSSLRSRRFPVHLWHPHFLRIKAFLDENVSQSCSAAIVMQRTCLCACRCETVSHEERQTKESCGWGSSARTQGLWHWTGRLFFPFTLCLSHTFHICSLWWKQRLTQTGFFF